MAVEATGSKSTCKTNYIIAIACLVFGMWYFYDGWFNEEYKNDNTIIDEETGKCKVTDETKCDKFRGCEKECPTGAIKIH